ncbi:hypothetical protein V8C44DRAFT_325352 [Trichoderma aethiopicum]
MLVLILALVTFQMIQHGDSHVAMPSHSDHFLWLPYPYLALVLVAEPSLRRGGCSYEAPACTKWHRRLLSPCLQTAQQGLPVLPTPMFEFPANNLSSGRTCSE